MKKYNIIVLLAAVINLVCSAAYIRNLPEKIPVHFNYEWVCDLVGSRWVGIIFPVLVLLMPLIFPLAEKYTKPHNRKPLSIIFLILTGYFLLVNWLALKSFSAGAVLGEKIEGSFIITILFVTFSCMFAAIGNYMPVIEQNRTLGIKIKWTLENEKCWKITHRFSGKLWVYTGLFMLIATIIALIAKINMTALTPVVFVIIATDIIFPCVVAYKHRND